MKIFKLILAANEVRGVDISGQYFELRKALYPVDVELLTKDGGIVSLLPSATESDYTREGVFQTVIITNGANPQTIEFWYGFGDAGSRRFSGNVSGTVDLSVATLAALESVDLNAASLANLKIPLKATNEFSQRSSVAANTAVEIIAPALNTAGIIILTAHLTEFKSAVGIACPVFQAKATPPVSVVDGSFVMAAKLNVGINAVGYWYDGQLIQPIFIAAGLGLYFISDYITDASSIRRATWRVL